MFWYFYFGYTFSFKTELKLAQPKYITSKKNNNNKLIWKVTRLKKMYILPLCVNEVQDIFSNIFEIKNEYVT